jgi:hypothetical protein
MSEKDSKRDQDDDDLDERDEAEEEETERAEDEDEDLADEEEDEEEDEEDAAPAKEPAPIRGAPPPPPPPRSPDEDPTWWVPHAVLGALVLMGVLGFFGAFNSTLGKMIKPRGGHAATSAAAESAKPAAPTTPAVSANKPQTPPKPPQAAGPVYGAKHLVVQWKGATRSKQERSKEEALKRTEEALGKLKGGAKFEDIAKEYSDEPGVANTGGNLGRFTRAGFDPKFVDAVEKLKVGEQSGVVESAFGYHIIVRTE